MLAWLLAVLCALASLVPRAAVAQAAGAPFACDVVFYQMRNAGSSSLPIRFAAVDSTITPTAIYTAVKGTLLNAVGYNPADNYLYGIQAATGAPVLYRIGQAGYERVGTVSNSGIGGFSLASFSPTAGVFDAAGRYYFAGQSTNIVPAAIFRVDSIPLSGGAQVSHQYNLNPSPVVNFGDFDFNGAGSPDGMLLGSVNNSHFRITLQPGSTPTQGTASVVTLPLATNIGGIGSAFYDAFTSRFFVFNNTTNEFWQIVNPESGPPSAAATSAVAYTGPPVLNGPYSSTDGTSCPLAGNRVADLRITKTDGVSSMPASAVTSYTITVSNAGPYPANYAVVRDPAAANLTKTSVTCTAPGGPPTAVCPPTLSVASLEAGVTVVQFPPQTTLVFTVNAGVSAPPGSAVTNTAIVLAPPGTSDPNLANNSATDVNAIVGTTTSVISAPALCPAGTMETYANLVSNADFSAGAPFASDATIGTANTYGPANAVSPQSGATTYLSGSVQQNPFAGDPGRSVPGGPGWLLSNGKAGAGNYRVWYQPVAGLIVGRTYEFMAYVSNASLPGRTSPTVPDLRLQVASGGAPVTLPGATASPANETVAGGDAWSLVQGSFTASVSAVTLSIANFAAASAEPGGGDVAGIAQATLRACSPSADVTVGKSNGTGTITSTGTTVYTITVSNPSTVTATDTLIVDPAAAGIVKTGVTCAATGANQCPASLSIAGLEGAGLTIPRVVPGGGTVVFQVTAGVTGAPGTTVSNAVSVSGVGYTDADPSNNSAVDTDLVIGQANLSIAKVHAAGAKVAGGTTSYTITVSNAGPSSVAGAVLRDPAAAGLSCTAAQCSGTVGAASCPAPADVTVAALQGAGIVVPLMSAPSSVIFRIDCGITATGL